MNKKKIVVCTILFSVVLIGSIVSTIFVKYGDGFSLYDLVTSGITTVWVCERIEKFYNWLKK